MIFYFNNDIGVCAEEDWVVDYLYMDGSFDSREEALDALNTKHEVYGWFECQVSSTIAEKFI